MSKLQEANQKVRQKQVAYKKAEGILQKDFESQKVIESWVKDNYKSKSQNDPRIPQNENIHDHMVVQQKKASK